MLDGLSLDQLRTSIAAAESGSFSEAGRRLGRAQSVVSQTIANLEGQIGLPLFERTGRLPVLTERGRSLLADARAVAQSVDAFKVRAKGMKAGLEHELSLVVDVMFPMPVLTSASRAFAETFPSVPLRLQVEALGAVAEPVIEGRCRLGVFASLPLLPAGLVKEPLLRVRLLMVAAPTHPLAAAPGPIPVEVLDRHVQLVLSDRSRLSEGRQFGVFSSRTWRLSDLGAKHAFLLAGLGWGSMPYSAVERDLAAGSLVPLWLEGTGEGTMHEISVYAIYRADAPPGPAGRWMIDHIRGYETGAAASDGAGTNAPDSACAMSACVSATP